MEIALPLTESTVPPAAPQVSLSRQKQHHDELDPCTFALAQQGQAAALERLVRHYQNPVFAFISRSTGRGPHVEDLAQEVFIRVIGALARFEVRDAKLSTWIFQIAVRLIQDRRKRYAPCLIALQDDFRGSEPSPEEECSAKRAIALMDQLVSQLPAEQRMTLVLVEFQARSHEEVSAIMGCPIATIKTRLFRARTYLRQGLVRGAEQ